MKAIVIGGGIGGLTLARACLDRGIDVELYEKRSRNEMLSGRGGIFMQRNALRVFKLLWDGQILERFGQQGGSILKGGFFNKSGQPLYINSPDFIQEDSLGLCLLRPELQKTLYDSLPAGTVTTECAFKRFEEQNEKQQDKEKQSSAIKVFFQDGTSTEGDILIGADGLYSSVRAQLEGKARLEAPVYSGMCCWRGYIDGTGLPLNDEFSWGEYWGQGSRFGFFDVGGNRFSFYGFDNAAPGSNDDAEGGALNALKKRFSDYGSPVPEILERMSEGAIYRDDIYDRPPLGKDWGQGRVTLIGDAAHPVLPNLGQGGCMAVEDAFELVKQLSGNLAAAGKETSVPVLLRQFEASRSDRVARIHAISRQVGQLGQLEGRIGCFLRNWLYRLTPTKLADQQFKWLFDYAPSWAVERVD
ncbi:MAG: FAD-dependent monooxygenase [Cyanobacteria bacterium P01_F01_bin.53]